MRDRGGDFTSIGPPMRHRANSFARRGGRVLLAAVALAAGCTALQPPRAESPTLYVLDAQPPRMAARVRRDAVIEVAVPRAWPGFDTPQIAYVREPHRVDYFANSRWADTLPQMLGPLLVRAIEETGSFRAVVPLRGNVAADVRLDTEIVRLAQNFATRPSRVEMTLHVQLTDVRARRVVASATFEDAETAPSENAAGGVAAANALLARMLGRVAEFSVTEAAGK
jgi:cholesterol transport system auxiliary component